MAGLGFLRSRRLYPIPFEGGRLLSVVAAGAVSYALSRLGPVTLLPGLAVKLAAVAVFPLLLWLFGLFPGRDHGSGGRL